MKGHHIYVNGTYAYARVFFWKDDPSNGRCNQAYTITCTASPEALPAPSREVPPAVHCVNTNAAEHTQIADCVDENILLPVMLTIARCRDDTFLVCAPAPPMTVAVSVGYTQPGIAHALVSGARTEQKTSIT